MNARQNLVAASVDEALSLLQKSTYDTPRIAPLREELEAAGSEIQALRLAQDVEDRLRAGEPKGGAAKLRDTLRRVHLRPISREGKRRLKGMPGIVEDLHLPHKRSPDDKLLDAAKRILAAATRHADVFRDAKFHPDFIARAQRAADALAAKEGVASTAIGRKARATASLKPALRNAREIIASIDSIVEADLADNAIALSMWRKAKRIPKRMGRPKKRK